MTSIQNDLLRACAYNDAEFLRKYVESHKEREHFAVVDTKQKWGPLHYAAFNKSYKCVKILLKTNLMDISQQSRKDETCLDLAISKDDHDISCAIVRLLLESDTTFSVMRDESEFKPLVKAIQLNSYRMVETIVRTLKKMKFEFSGASQALRYAITSLRFETDDDKSKSVRILQSIFPLIFDEHDYDFMQLICETMLLHVDDSKPDLLKWFIERFHLAETNQHRDLVQKLLDNPKFGFNNYIIFGLHSGIKSQSIGLENFVHLTKNSGKNSYQVHRIHAEIDIYKKIVNGLPEVDVTNCDIINEVGKILWPKLKPQLFSEAYQDVLVYNQGNQKYVKMTSLKWLDTMQLSSAFGNVFGEQFENCIVQLNRYSWLNIKPILNVLMPFSTEVSADTHISNVSRKLDMAVNRLKQEKKKLNKRKFFDPDDMVDAYYDWQGNMHAAKNSVEQFSDAIECYDTELTKFCVEGKYRAGNSLQGLCRAAIRKSLLQPNTKGVKICHSELVKAIQTLELPNYLQQSLKMKYAPEVIQRFLRFIID